ncbi:enoyl-CoA hydratase-related protein (plasmid) [Sinorhizobium numidicum]|uniref:Enoyl-CoA hydratase-related protein n=1 Tax=Sinorhizobium numidicum TaxID=680248 RepID=A0ABY8D3C9_9HYPH|nr:enoyl-CoA hydratase-related protein [Sinorhizobium numidicum]WEX79667.1 enoyl-CoA hydratase-related protein [Sinorhizobium numidicum]WEX85379.1 enoyl-CoA hydratase-related protein [Sinorhizobium numidicum]
MVYTKLAVETENGYVVAAINHPPANALGQKVLFDLNTLLDESLEDPEIRAIVLTGTGEKLFSAGADITEFDSVQAGDKPNQINPKIEGNDVFSKIENYPKPVIAAIQGSAYGGGTEISLACHFRILADTAKVALPEVKLGIMPGWGGTQRLPRLIGKTKALEMMLTGDPLSSAEAFSFGLVNKVVPASQVLAEAKALAARLAQGAPVAIRGILKAVTKGLETTIDEGIKIEDAASVVVSASEDAKEGPRAFLEKRKANFRGI